MRGMRVCVRVLVCICRVGVIRVRMRFMRVRAVCMLGLVRCFARRNHVDLGSGQATAAHLAHLKTRAYIQRGRCFFETGKGDARIHQGAKQHVAADA